MRQTGYACKTAMPRLMLCLIICAALWPLAPAGANAAERLLEIHPVARPRAPTEARMPSPSRGGSDALVVFDGAGTLYRLDIENSVAVIADALFILSPTVTFLSGVDRRVSPNRFEEGIRVGYRLDDQDRIDRLWIADTAPQPRE